MSDIQSRKITLKVGKMDPMVFTIPKDTEAEKHLRQGATEINRLLEKYSSAYPEAEEVELMTYVALHISKGFVALKEEVGSLDLESQLTQFIQQIDCSLSQTTNDRRESNISDK